MPQTTETAPLAELFDELIAAQRARRKVNR